MNVPADLVAMGGDPAAGMMSALSAEDRANAQKAAQAADDAKIVEFIKYWFKEVDHARVHDEKARKQWAEDRKMAAGDYAGESEWAVTANLIGANLEILQSFLFAKNPTPQVRPSASVNRTRIELYQQIAETAEIICDRMWKKARLKSKGKRQLRAAMTVGIGWLRAGMQTRTEVDPIVENEINDLKQQMLNYEGLIAQGENDEYCAAKSRAESQLVALEAKKERQIATGMTMDTMAAEDVIVSAECSEIDAYLDAPWIAFDLYKTITQAMAITGWSEDEVKACTRYQQRPRKPESDTGCATYVAFESTGSNADNETLYGFVRFIEIWSKQDGVVITLLQGCKTKLARPQYAPLQSQRFYDVFGLMFHPFDQLRYPVSDVKQLTPLQQEYSSRRSNFRLHRERAIPGVIFNSGLIKPDDAKKLTASVTQEYTGIDPESDGPMENLFATKKYSQIDPALYETETIQRDMEKISGAQEALQGAVSVEKTATEAKIQDSGFGARIEFRRSDMEAMFSDLAEHTVQLAFQVIDQATALRFAGEDRAWIQLSAEDAHVLYDVDVKAGSSGRPKATQDRETWGTLMPLIQGMQDQIAQLRSQGPQTEWIVKPKIALLNETLKRLDDPAQLSTLIPVAPAPDPLMMGAPGAAPAPIPTDPAAAAPVAPPVAP